MRLVHLEEDLAEDGVEVNADPLTRVGTAVWDMLYADDAGFVSESAESFVNLMTVIVTVFEAAGLTVLKTTETILVRTPDQAPLTSPLVIEAADQKCRQAMQFSIWAVLSTQAPSQCPRLNAGSDSHGHATKRLKRELYEIWRLPRSL